MSRPPASSGYETEADRQAREYLDDLKLGEWDDAERVVLTMAEANADIAAQMWAMRYYGRPLDGRD